MIVPDAEDVTFLTKLTHEFNARYPLLHQNFSPILPLHFDKAYLPKNICQKQLIYLMQCTVFRYTGADNDICSYEIASFQQCRKNRDMRILEGIREWESKHIRGLDQQNRRMYLQGLTFKLDRLKEEYEKMPSTQAKVLKLHRIQSQIEQLKWRMKNISTIIKQQSS